MVYEHLITAEMVAPTTNGSHIGKKWTMDQLFEGCRLKVRMSNSERISDLLEYNFNLLTVFSGSRNPFHEKRT